MLRDACTDAMWYSKGERAKKRYSREHICSLRDLHQGEKESGMKKQEDRGTEGKREKKEWNKGCDEGEKKREIESDWK